MSTINLGPNGGTPPDATQQEQIRGALGLGSAAVEDVSQTGGVAKVIQTDVVGDLTLGSFTNDSNSSSPGGRLFIPPFRKVIYMDDHGGIGASTYVWANHQGDGLHEIIHECHKHCYYHTDGIQYGSPATVGDNRHVYFQGGTATESIEIVFSTPLAQIASVYNDGDPEEVRFWSQVVPASAADTVGELVISSGGWPSGAHVLSGETECARISPSGIRHAGTAPAFAVLEATANVFTQACSPFKTVQNAYLELGATNTLEITGAVNGMRGVIMVQQDTSGNRTLTLPTGSAKAVGWALSTAADVVDRLTWEYDGTYFYWGITKGLVKALDDDASAFLTAAEITDPDQSLAVNTLVLGLKSNSLWEKFYALYPFIGGNATAHAKDLKGSFHGTFAGSPTHNSNGITGNASDARFDTGFDWANDATDAQDNCAMYLYDRSAAAPTNGGHIAGSMRSTPDYNLRFVIAMSTTMVAMGGVNNLTSNASQTWVPGHLVLQRSASNVATLQVNSDAKRTNTDVSTGCVAVSNAVMCSKQGTGYSNYSNANIAFAAFTVALTDGEWTTFRALIDTFQTALSRNV